MLRTIQLNYNFLAGDIKIHDILTKYILPMDGNWKLFQAIIPEMAFFLGHGIAQLSGISNQFPVVLFIHLKGHLISQLR